MDDNLKQKTNNKNTDNLGGISKKDNITNESPRLNEAPAREKALTTPENISDLEKDSPTSKGDNLKKDSSQSSVETPSEEQDNLDEDFESYMDDSAL